VSGSQKLYRAIGVDWGRRSAEMDVEDLKREKRKAEQELQTFIEYGQSQALEEALSSIPGLSTAVAERDLERLKRDSSPTAEKMREELKRHTEKISEAEDTLARKTRASLNKASLR
jgi:hypothetical protein